MSWTDRIAAAWDVLSGAVESLPSQPVRAGVLNDGSLVVMSKELGTLVLGPQSARVLRNVLQHADLGPRP